MCTLTVFRNKNTFNFRQLYYSFEEQGLITLNSLNIVSICCFSTHGYVFPIYTLVNYSDGI